MMNIQVIIPVYNPDDRFEQLLVMLQKQSLGKLPVLIIDSGQKHGYREKLDRNGIFTIKDIPGKEFNHGGTRQLGIEMFPDKDVYVFLTQDALLVDEYSIERLVASFDNSAIGAAYGRQLPYGNASVFSKMAREYNYDSDSCVKSFADRSKYGMKTCFLSNSFAAYRREAIVAAGGFPTDTILGEDMYVAAKMLMGGWKVAYVAEACVYHSHNYTVWQEFKRYFDIGVFHSRERWIREAFGHAEGAGLKFLKMEVITLCNAVPIRLVEMVIRDGMKYIGYQLGLHEKWMPKCVKTYISMTKSYWM